MKNHLLIYLYGAIITLVGIFLLFSDYSTIKMINTTIGISLMVGAVLAFGAAFLQKRKRVQFAYHEMHALAMLVYGVSILAFSDTLEKFISFTAVLFLFYSMSEIIFCNWLFELSQKVVYKIITDRILLGLSIGIGTIVILNSPEFTLIGFGMLFILVGINIIFYVPVMKNEAFSKI